MTARRCPNCGGLVAPDAEWCGQCLTRLDGRPEPAPPTADPVREHAEAGPPARTAPPRADAPSITPADSELGVRVTEDGVVWDCPTCGEENPIETQLCTACGTRFGRLFEDPETVASVEPGRAVAMSLVFPGLGHYVAGRRAEGVARAIVFTFALTIGLLALFGKGGGGSPVFLVVMVVSLGAAVGLYFVTMVDAGRAAERVAPILSTRVLLYGAVGLMLVTLTLLTIATLQAAPRGPA